MRNILKAATLESKFPLLAVEDGCILSKDADVTVGFKIRVLGEDAPVLDGEKGELTFQGGRFEYVSHIFFV